MNDQVRRARVQELVEAVNTRDLEFFDALYHDDVVVHWPQSGEVIRGKDNIRQVSIGVGSRLSTVSKTGGC